MGDRQFGWAGVRPVCDVLLRHDEFARSALDVLAAQLDAMTARYRIGDGTGGTYVDLANNCAQDSNRALFATLRAIRRAHEAGGTPSPLRRLEDDLRRKLQPFGFVRRDWSHNEYNLGTTMEDAPVANLLAALESWRCILPRLAFNTVASTFLADGATAYVLGSDTLGGPRTDVRPIVPFAP
jgi:predicted Abi (CAAX) family protease